MKRKRSRILETRVTVVREAHIIVRTTPEEKAAIKAKAKAKHTTVSDLIRDAINAYVRL